MTRSITEHIAISTTPANTGASADACRIVAMLFEHDGFRRIAQDDADGNYGFIAHLCRRVTQELAQIELEKNMAEWDRQLTESLAASEQTIAALDRCIQSFDCNAGDHSDACPESLR